MKMMKLMGWLVSVMAIAMLVVGPMTGCGGGSGSKSGDQTVVTTTKGQELQDLDAAYKKGIITEKEYEEQKKAILKKK